MEQRDIVDALVLVKRTGNLLDEVMDLSKQLGEALDRNDNVSVRMLLVMRGEPIEKLKIVDRAIRDKIRELGDEDAERMCELLKGDGPTNDMEKQLTELVAANRRQKAKVLELDKVVNMKLTRDKSIYH